MSENSPASPVHMKGKLSEHKGVLIMQNKLFLKAADVCELLEVSTTSAYEIIANLNSELEKKGRTEPETGTSVGTECIAEHG